MRIIQFGDDHHPGDGGTGPRARHGCLVWLRRPCDRQPDRRTGVGIIDHRAGALGGLGHRYDSAGRALGRQRRGRLLARDGARRRRTAFATTTSCLASVFQTTTITAAAQAAINAVAGSPAWRILAARFPSTAENRSCGVVRRTPAPSARTPATCATFVTEGPGLEMVSSSEGWSGRNARRDDGLHT